MRVLSCSDYPLGLGCFKEFLANADDAGAAAFAVVLDMREHGKVPTMF